MDGKESPAKIYNGKYLNVIFQRKTYQVHRLIAMAFIPNPDKKPYINHKDGNKHNNSIDNLEWCTASENNKHAWRTGLNHTPNGHRTNGTALREARIKAGLSVADVMKAIGVSDAAVYQWETGIYTPRKEKLLAVSELYNCTIDELLKGGEDAQAQ